MTALSLEHVTKVFPGNVRAVDDSTLDVAEGELLVLVGPSGCGKTTVLRMIAGLERPTHGTVMLAGRAADGVAPKVRHVALVFQHHALYPHLSVYGNMAFGLRLRGTAKTEIERRIGEAAAALGIEELLDRRPGELSGGQQQRVALGRAMVRQPRILLCDEPLSNLDAGLRTQLRHEIRRLHARLGTTTIYVTHDQTEAMTLGQRIAVLREGRLQQVADPTTIYERPANRFVAGLIGSPAMNFFPSRLAPALVPGDRRAVLLGIRPEHLTVSAAKDQTGAACIPAVIEAVERLGPESHLHLRAGAHTFIARACASAEFRGGQSVAVRIDADHLHFFDAETGEAIAK